MSSTFFVKLVQVVEKVYMGFFSNQNPPQTQDNWGGTPYKLKESI